MRTLLFVAATLIASSAAAYPVSDRGALEGGASTSGLAVSDDGRYIATSQRSDGAGLAIWDRLAPSAAPELVDMCEAVDVVWTTHATLGDAFYVACGTNEVHRVDLDTSTVPPSGRVGDAIVVGMEGETNVALGYAPGDTFVHVTSSADSLTFLHAIDIATDTVDGGTGLPASDAGTPVDIVLPGTSDLGPVVVAQSDGSLLWATRSGTTWSVQAAQSLTGTISSITADPKGVATEFVLTLSTGEAWALAHSNPAGIPSLFDDSLSSPVASAHVAQSSGSPVVWIVGSNNTVSVFDLEGSFLEDVELASTGAPVAIAPDPASTDSVWVAGGDGTVRAVTDRPWVTALATDVASLGAGEEFTVTFTVDVDCDYDLRIDSGLSAAAGTSLDTGTATADTEVSVTLKADDLTSEGDNRLVLFATDAGAVGVDSTVVTLDTPPEAISDLALESGDGRILLTWTSTDEVDIATYRIYVSDTVFTKDDDELPTLSLVDEEGNDVDYPLDISAGEASTAHSTSITGLANASTYWVAIQAIDDAGNTGPLSDVLSASPEQTCGLVECYGDPGCTCSTVEPTGSALVLALVGLALGRVRRRA